MTAPDQDRTGWTTDPTRPAAMLLGVDPALDYIHDTLLATMREPRDPRPGCDGPVRDAADPARSERLSAARAILRRWA